MYHSHWGIDESPFQSRLDPQFFYESPTHDEALSRLHFLVAQRRRLGLLMGESGSGKSLLLEAFATQLRRQGRPVAMVNLLGVGPAEMLCLLAGGFGLNIDASAPVAKLWRSLTDRLAEYRYQQLDTIILLDDAAEYAETADGRQVISLVTRLAQHDCSPQSRLTIVLSGRCERMGRIGRRLLELAELRIDVESWQQSETADFLEKSLAQAGCQSPIFDEPALAKLHELSHGVPRRVSQLADLALLAGAGAELQQIDADVVESAYQELGVIEV